MASLTLDRHIATSPARPGGKPCIAGRLISVADIAVWHERMGMSVDVICAEYELTLAEVYAALAYYFDHKSEIDTHLVEDDAFVNQLRAATPSVLGQKLKTLRGE